MHYETVQEAARRLGWDPSTVRRACRSGRLPACKRFGEWHIACAPASPPADWPYLSTEEAARALGVSVGVVTYQCRNLQLGAHRRARVWHIPREAVAELGGGEECLTLARS